MSLLTLLFKVKEMLFSMAYFAPSIKRRTWGFIKSCQLLSVFRQVNVCLGKGSAYVSPLAETDQPLFLQIMFYQNTASPAYVFAYCLWLLSDYSGTVDYWFQTPFWHAKPKIFTSQPFVERINPSLAQKLFQLLRTFLTPGCGGNLSQVSRTKIFTHSQRWASHPLLATFYPAHSSRMDPHHHSHTPFN